MVIKIKSTKINKITNQRTQLPFGAVDMNFKDMKEKGYRKEKKT
jgi:hypothetical protein